MKPELIKEFLDNHPALKKRRIAEESGWSLSMFDYWLKNERNASHSKLQALLWTLLKYGFKCKHEWKKSKTRYIGYYQCKYCGMWK